MVRLGTACDPVTVESPASGRPHEGKVLAAIQAHADDIPLFCAGTLAKLLDEGYKGYLIQTTNDEKCAPTPSLGETILRNEQEVDELARIMGLEAVYNLGYRNHRLDEASPLELRSRLVLLFRALKVDTVLTFNPWGHGEENPDHVVTAQAVEAARWMAGMGKDYPEQIAAGLKPHTVQEQYYWVCREGQPYNRVIDVAPYIEKKIEAMSVNKSQGPGGANGSRLRDRLASNGLRLPALGDNNETADREYIRLFGLDDFRATGERHGLTFAEPFLHIPPGGTFVGAVDPNLVEAYISEHAVPAGE
ncbi:MAG: PIG-L family deacetylase [Candidatus Latescibacteria bacterium]|jgi:LmbE family N-acetylglucosaminyl deacetylase|nr:PIG-L family deacetylase [Candidatus Latescibacterota bacterium]